MHDGDQNLLCPDAHQAQGTTRQVQQIWKFVAAVTPLPIIICIQMELVFMATAPPLSAVSDYPSEFGVI